MSRLVRLLALMLMAASLLLMGCTGSVKMPINEYSHVRVEASPFEQSMQFSYHLYERRPSTEKATRWEKKIEVDSLGTLYDSKKTYSPLARDAEEVLDTIWDDDEGFLSWAELEEAITETRLSSDKAEESTQTIDPPENKPFYRSITELPPLLATSPGY